MPTGRGVYTDPSCPSGSDRVVAALNARGLISTAGHPTAGHDHTASCLPLHPPPSHPDAVLSASFPFDVIVNVQGDEPLLNPTHIDSAVHALLESPDADIATLVHRLDTTSKTVSGHFKLLFDFVLIFLTRYSHVSTFFICLLFPCHLNTSTLCKRGLKPQ